MRMRRFVMIRRILPALAVAMLAGCTTAQQAAVTTGLQNAQAACTAAAPIVKAAPTVAATQPASIQATVGSLVTYEESVCASEATLDAAVAADSSGGAGTSAWLVNIAGGLLQALPGLLTVL
jgi:hypothetical protein